MKKNDTYLLGGLGILVVAFLLMNNGGVQPSTTSGGVQSGNVVVNAFQPTLGYSVTDELKGSVLSGNRAEVTLAGSKSTLAQGTTLNANNGDAYSVELWPTSTYYSPAAKSGTISGAKTETFQSKLIATSLSDWANNDPSNATTRNAAASTDTIGSGGSANPEFCLKNSTQFSIFGSGKYGVIVDYNGLTYDKPSASGAVDDSSVIISNHSRGAGTTASAGFRINEELGEGETKCITLTLQAKSGVNPSQTDGNLYWRWVDNFKYVDSVDATLQVGYETDTGADTNSATNQTGTYIVD